MAGITLLKHKKVVYRSDQNQDSGDDFGLPDTGASSTGGSGTQPPYKKKMPEPEIDSGSSKAGIIIVILLVVVAAFLVYWFVFRKPTMKEKIALKPDTTAVHKTDTLAQAPVKTDTVAAKPAMGMIDTISERTGRYYVIISSSVDADLATDYAKKLAAKGVSCKLLGPVTDRKFHRLAVADFGTLNEANSKLEELKGMYGSECWVMKY